MGSSLNLAAPKPSYSIIPVEWSRTSRLFRRHLLTLITECLRDHHGHIEIQFELDLVNPEHSFVGYAKVSVTNLEPETHKAGLILHGLVYETVVSLVTNSPQEQRADSMTRRIVPSFPLVDQDYFSDRELG